jgi:predicted nicotinamide N-methyase
MLATPSHFRRDRLLARIQRRYQTVTESIAAGPFTIGFTRAAEPNRVLDDIVAEEDRREKATGVRLADPPHLPYWAELWDSARGMADVIATMEFPPHTRILDLGCGMGLCGAVAAARGGNVLLADLEPPALLFARLNTLSAGARARVRRVDWQTDSLGEQFDLILGADILYERKQWEFLVEFWKVHLAAGGSILLGEPGRPSGDLFIPWIQQRGWSLWESSIRPRQSDKTIRIFKLERALS